MRLAYFTPLNPQACGISDYNEELLPYLAAHADIDLFLDGFQPSNEDLPVGRVFDYQKNPHVLGLLRNYDAAIYHIGNDYRFHFGTCTSAAAASGNRGLPRLCARRHFSRARA